MRGKREKKKKRREETRACEMGGIENEIYERSATIAAKTLMYTYEYQHFGESARCPASLLGRGRDFLRFAFRV